MADEARAMLDALMGADRNAPVEGASGISGTGGGGGPTRRQKRSCYEYVLCVILYSHLHSSSAHLTFDSCEQSRRLPTLLRVVSLLPGESHLGRIGGSQRGCRGHRCIRFIYQYKI